MTVIAQMSALLLQGAATAADTMIVRPAGTGPGWYVIFTQVTTAASVVVFLVLMLVLIPALLKFRKTAEKLDVVLDHLERNIEPVTRHATHIADNVDYISTSIRADVQELRKTLLAANSGVREMIEASERRLHELSAVLRVVQEEAEHAFVSTASAIRGVRAGATTFRENGARLAEDDELDDLGELEDLEDVDDDEFSDALTESDELEDIDEDDEGIDTINDLNAARDAAEDMTNGDDNGSALGRAEPRIKRARRRDRG
jgi:uncharacterized protein YoxC